MPVADAVQPTCDEPFGSIEVEYALEGVVYTLTGAGETESNEEGVFVDWIPVVYHLSVTEDDCTSEELVIELEEPSDCEPPVAEGTQAPNCSNFSPAINGDGDAIVSARDFLTNAENVKYPFKVTEMNKWGGDIISFKFNTI